MTGGFYKRRRGILEHLESGKIGLLDLAVHDYLNLMANLLIGSDCSIPPGVCFSSAVAIHALCPREVSERSIRRSLEHLERIGWIKRWQERGKRGNYPILICRASVHDMSSGEYRVNGVETTDWRNPVLIPAADRPHSGPVLSGDRDTRVENREKKNLAAKPTPPADPRFQPFFAFAFEAFTSKHERKPPWQGKDHKGLKGLLRSQSAESLPLERLQTIWRNFLDSTEAFTVKQGNSMAYFCANVDKFSDGPILAVPERGTNGRSNINQAIEQTLNSYVIREGVAH